MARTFAGGKLEDARWLKERERERERDLSHVENLKSRIREAIRDGTSDNLDQIWEEIIDVTYFLWQWEYAKS
jgi:hypothetical protein